MLERRDFFKISGAAALGSLLLPKDLKAKLETFLR